MLHQLSAHSSVCEAAEPIPEQWGRPVRFSNTQDIAGQEWRYFTLIPCGSTETVLCLVFSVDRGPQASRASTAVEHSRVMVRRSWRPLHSGRILESKLSQYRTTWRSCVMVRRISSQVDYTLGTLHGTKEPVFGSHMGRHGALHLATRKRTPTCRSSHRLDRRPVVQSERRHRLNGLTCAWQSLAFSRAASSAGAMRCLPHGR